MKISVVAGAFSFFLAPVMSVAGASAKAPGRLCLYDDDGETFAFEDGKFSWTNLAATKDANGKWRGSVTRDANGLKWSYSDITWTFMNSAGGKSP